MDLISVCIGIIIGFVIGAAFAVFVGLYYDGELIVDDSDDETTHWTLQYNKDPMNITKRKSIRFRVKTK